MVKPRFEKRVSLVLREKGFEECVPLVAQSKVWSDRIKTVMLPLIPQYVFCRIPYTDRIHVLSTPGVLRVVGFGHSPSPVPDREVDSLRTLAETTAVTSACDYLAAGQLVRVVKGPLAGVEGILKETKTHSRIVVSVHLLQRSVTAEVDRSAVVPVSVAAPGIPSARVA